MTTYLGFFDGSITVNPGGDMGIGCLLYEIVDGRKELIFEHSETLLSKFYPNGTSNNVAECLALSKLLSYLILEDMQTAKIEIRGDSQIILNRLMGIGKNKPAKGMFAPYLAEVIQIVPQFSNITFTWKGREHNTEADKLSKVQYR